MVFDCDSSLRGRKPLDLGDMDNRITDKIMDEREDDLISGGKIREEITKYFRRGNYYRRLWEARQRGLRKRMLKYYEGKRV